MDSRSRLSTALLWIRRGSALMVLAAVMMPLMEVTDCVNESAVERVSGLTLLGSDTGLPYGVALGVAAVLLAASFVPARKHPAARALAHAAELGLAGMASVATVLAMVFYALFDSVRLLAGGLLTLSGWGLLGLAAAASWILRFTEAPPGEHGVPPSWWALPLSLGVLPLLSLIRGDQEESFAQVGGVAAFVSVPALLASLALRAGLRDGQRWASVGSGVLALLLALGALVLLLL